MLPSPRLTVVGFGADGWELVSLEPISTAAAHGVAAGTVTNLYLAVFKRRKLPAGK